MSGRRESTLKDIYLTKLALMDSYGSLHHLL